MCMALAMVHALKKQRAKIWKNSLKVILQLVIIILKANRYNVETFAVEFIFVRCEFNRALMFNIHVESNGQS